MKNSSHLFVLSLFKTSAFLAAFVVLPVGGQDLKEGSSSNCQASFLKDAAPPEASSPPTKSLGLKLLSSLQKQAAISESALKDTVLHLFSTPEIVQQYSGMEGYKKFSDEYCGGNMRQCFRLVSKHLGRPAFKPLGWHEFRGTTEGFNYLTNKLMTTHPSGRLVVRSQYIGMDNYVLLAEADFNGDLFKCFINVSAVLGKRELKRLKWRIFRGQVLDFINLKAKLIDSKGRPVAQYQHMEGFADLSAELDINMYRLFSNAGAALSKSDFRKLKWKEFNGHADFFWQTRRWIMDENGFIREEYKEPKGHILFSDTYYGGNMRLAFKNVSALLPKGGAASIKWRLFYGETKEFKELPDWLKNKHKILKIYLGMNGYAEFADLYYGGDMFKAFVNVKAALGEEFKTLGWRLFMGSTQQFRSMRGALMDKDGRFLPQYKTITGGILFSEEYFEGDMVKTFTNAAAVFTKQEKTELDWHYFSGTADQFHALVDDFAYFYPQGWQGLGGQKRVADKIYKGHLFMLYRDISVVKAFFFGADHINLFNQLGWQSRAQAKQSAPLPAPAGPKEAVPVKTH